MMRSVLAVLAVTWLLSGCAAYRADYSPPQETPLVTADSGLREMPAAPGQQPLQCVPYARAHSQVKIYGDAWTWWDQAAGKYERGLKPASGHVMVLHDYAGPKHGHLAVVRRIVSTREIRVDHANWLNDGSIYVNNPVVDVSPANDWSQVRVFNIQTGAWGGKTYPVKGFIGAGSNPPVETRKPAPPVEEEAPDGERPIGDLIAELSSTAPKPVRIAAARPATVPTAATQRLQPVSATAADRNPPADSPFALTADDLSIPGDTRE